MNRVITNYLESQFWESDELAYFAEREMSVVSGLLPDGAILFQTSGSSGEVKWVVHTRESLLYSARLVVEHLSVRSSDVWFLALPICHVGGFGVLARSYVSGCAISHFEEKWDAVRAVEFMQNDRVTVCSFVPTQLVDIVRAQIVCPSNVRSVVVGGGKLDPEVKRRAIVLGWPILESYGMTETGSQIATQLEPSEQGISLIEGWKVKHSPEGVLRVKGRGLLSGYLRETDGGIEFDDPKSEDGWFTTADMVDINEQSNSLIFRLRNDRVVKVLGELVSLDLLEHDLTESCETTVLIVDLIEERRGAKLVPVIESKARARFDLSKLKLSGLYALEAPVFLESFPRNAMGKLDRKRLRESVVFLTE